MRQSRPERFDNTSQLQTHNLDAICRSLSSKTYPELVRSGSGGSNVTIGILDTALNAPKQMRDGVDVDVTRDYRNSKIRDESGHGTTVFAILSALCPNATFNFYRVLDDRKVIDPGEMLKPIQDAINDGVDILNISAGYSTSDTSPDTLIAHAVRDACNNGMSIVAASGNLEEPGEQVDYPAMVDEAIAVGGYVSMCTATQFSKPEARAYEQTHQNVNRHWAYAPAVARPEQSDMFYGIYCSQRGCSNSDSCQDNRFEEWWQGNVNPRGCKPDILAPPYIPDEQVSGVTEYKYGSSFSCPIVSGLLSLIHVDSPTSNIDPIDLRNAVISGGKTIDDNSGDKFCYEDTLRAL